MNQPLKIQPLQSSALGFKKYASHEDYRVILPEGQAFENLLDPYFWSNVAKKFVPFDEIQVIAEDGAWIAEFYVIQCGDNWARIALKNKLDLHATAVEDDTLPAGYSIKFGGPVVGWSILRGAERVFPQKPYNRPADKGEALEWLKVHTKNLAA